MKKYVLIIVIIVCALYSCGPSNQDNLLKMREAVKEHVKKKDLDNNTSTDIEYLKAISYKEIPQDKRIQANDAYLCKMYLKGKWSYLEGSRVYNIDDTLSCYFDKDLLLLRVEYKDR